MALRRLLALAAAATVAADVVQVVLLCDYLEARTAGRQDCDTAIAAVDAILGIKHPKTFNVQAAAYQARQKLAAMEPRRRATLEDALAAFAL